MIAAQQPSGTWEPQDRTPRAGWEPHGDNSGAGSAPPPSKHTPASLGQKVWNEHHRYCLLRSKWFRGGTWVETKEKKGAVYLCNCKLVSTQRKSIGLSLPAALLCCCRVGWSADKNSIIMIWFCSGISAETVWMSTYVKKKSKRQTPPPPKVLSQSSAKGSASRKRGRVWFSVQTLLVLDLHATVGQSATTTKIRKRNNNLESD